MSIAEIIILSILILIGIGGIALGIHEIVEFQDANGVLAIISSGILLIISFILIACVIPGDNNNGNNDNNDNNFNNYKL